MIRRLFSSPLTRVTESEKAGWSNADHHGCGARPLPLTKGLR